MPNQVSVMICPVLLVDVFKKLHFYLQSPMSHGLFINFQHIFYGTIFMV